MRTDTITNVSFDITYKCNLRCRHCFNTSGEQKYTRDMLSKQEIIDISDQFSEIRTIDNVCFCGGEPLIKKEALFSSARLINDKLPDVSVNFVTNGLLIDESVIQSIKDSGIYMVQVSVDGLDADSHN